MTGRVGLLLLRMLFSPVDECHRAAGNVRRYGIPAAPPRANGLDPLGISSAERVRVCEDRLNEFVTRGLGPGGLGSQTDLVQSRLNVLAREAFGQSHQLADELVGRTRVEVSGIVDADFLVARRVVGQVDEEDRIEATPA